MRYNLKFRKLTLYGLTRPQSIRKLKQISGQENRGIQVVKLK